jgi:superfamily II DNA or RNA helicase
MNVTRYADINIEDPKLRPYQQKAKREIFEAWDTTDNVMFQMPTGTGKTRLFTSIIKDINEYSKNVKEPVKILIIAHRTELIDQIHENLEKYGVPHNVIAGGRDRNYKLPVNVASIQTLTHPNNLAAAKKLKVQFVIIDEAHHALASSYKKLWNLYPGSKKLGVTATPWRMNHQSFLDLFDTLVMSMSIKDFIRQGFLSPYKYYSLRSDSDIQKTIDGIELDRFGEYSEASMEEKMDIGSIRAQLLESYLSLAEGKKGIIYAINIAHAKHISKEYESAGYITACIDSKTPSAERKELVEDFRRGKIDIIVNVDIFSEGFDCPDIEFIQLARPTRSLVKYLQQVGRGLRPTENKEHCIILDNVGMYSRFGLPDARRHWNYHFMGHKVDDETPKGTSKGNGKRREIDMSEGTEDMELIQDSYEDIEPDTNTNGEELSKDTEQFDPIELLEANNFLCENFIFYFTQSKIIYETYIQDDKYFIISELVIDESNHSVHRNRVGKIPSDSWMYWQMLREKIDNLRSIVHYGANYTVFHYRVMSSDNIEKDKYFDYKGREIVSPESVKSQYEQEIAKGQVSNYIDVPVSKANFRVTIDGSNLVVYRTIKDQTRQIAKISPITALARTLPISVRLVTRKDDTLASQQSTRYNANQTRIVMSDDNSLTVRTVENGKGYLLKFSLEGKLLKKGTIASNSEEVEDPIRRDDIERLKHAFDKKATSYKYFWFLSLLDIYKGSHVPTITFKQILVKMVAKAWKYVFMLNGQFPKTDQLPSYLINLLPLTKLKYNSTEAEVEYEINTNFASLELNSKLNSLLKNVPYRFLSPWIAFTSNDEVKNKSRDSESRCPYKLYDDCITITKLWRETLISNYNVIELLAEYGLEDFLGINQDFKDKNDFYNKRFTSLNKLVKAIAQNQTDNFVNLFMEKYQFTEKFTYSVLRLKMPLTQYEIDDQGNKRINVPGGMWSLKILDKLLANENMSDNIENVHLLSGFGVENYLKQHQKQQESKDFTNSRFPSLSKLLKGIKMNCEDKAVKSFLNKYGFSLTGNIKPTEVIAKVPESKCIIDDEGRKSFNMPGAIWTLKTLDELLSN